MTLDPPISKTHYLNELRGEITFICTANNLLIILLSLGAIFQVIVITLTVIVYSTWNVMAIIVPEFKWLLVANYNLIISSILLIPLFYLIGEDDYYIFVILASYIVFTITSSVFALVLRRIKLTCICFNINSTKYTVLNENLEFIVPEEQIKQFD